MIDRQRILELIPHQHGMCLLDAVEHWDAERIHASSDSHRRIDNPLRRGDRLAALHLCEYGAQAMAVHGGLLAADAVARPGLLVSLRAVELHCDYVDLLEEPLQVHAEVLLATADSWQYQFRIEHAGALLASGRAAVMLHAGAAA